MGVSLGVVTVKLGVGGVVDVAGDVERGVCVTADLGVGVRNKTIATNKAINKYLKEEQQTLRCFYL